MRQPQVIAIPRGLDASLRSFNQECMGIIPCRAFAMLAGAFAMPAGACWLFQVDRHKLIKMQAHRTAMGGQLEGTWCEHQDRMSTCRTGLPQKIQSELCKID